MSIEECAKHFFFGLSGYSSQRINTDPNFNDLENTYVSKHAALKFLYKGATIVTAPIPMLGLSAFTFLGFLLELTSAFIFLCQQNTDKAKLHLENSSKALMVSLAAAVYAPFTPLMNLWNFIETAINACRTPSDVDAALSPSRTSP